EEKIAAVERFLEESSLLNTFFSCRHVPTRPRSPRNTRPHHNPTDIAPPLPPPLPSSATPSTSIMKKKRQDSSSTDEEEDRRGGKKKKPATRKRSRQSDDETSRDDDEIKKPRKNENKNNKKKKNNSSSSSASTSGIVIPELPELFKAIILSLNGTDVTFVMKKEITETDVTPNNNRLSMPEKQINPECKFLTDPEIRRIIESKNEKERVIGLEVGLVEPCGEVCSQVLKRWKMTSAYTYNLAKSSWISI
ncbi:hypothetical protein PIB30_112491, partial [Stylosanthes scabra]|nr:hypothetical protein [Stylosanthes scabra]